jgi:glutamate-5-semialdehyde dehydrogenase
LRAAPVAMRTQAVILESSARDLSIAQGKSLAPAFLDRLTLDTKRIEAIAQGLGAIAVRPCPILSAK